MDFTGILQTLIGGALGGAIIPLLTHAKEKRIARSAVREHLSQVEQQRWCTTKDAEAERQFIRATERLEAVALSAGIHKEVVRTYINLAGVAFYSTQRSVEKYVDMEGQPLRGGALDSDTAAVVEGSHELLTDAIWHPVRSALLRRQQLRRIRRTVALLIELAYIDDPNDDGLTDWDSWEEDQVRSRVKLRNVARRAKENLARGGTHAAGDIYRGVPAVEGSMAVPDPCSEGTTSRQ
ncbi:hypothetical protein ACGFIK_03415 [Micromonospora sp. NPDC048871]|uniref:hypothetical protein n=1 Tax=unclassified Micromonospora TaxID=2617518 RepID=UPI002E131091|nr:hypothetical protein OIE53_17240 [Micromonospora sp. NBC_01739]